MSATFGVALVVGGCGYLGSNLVKALRAESPCTAVHVVSRNPEQNRFTEVVYHAGGISDAPQVADSQQLKYLAGGCQWDITKAEQKLGYQPVTDQDATIKKVAQAEIKRLAIVKKQI
ncbi:hypothetical protein UA08_08404 [Talaromyces atroroseus]|uniref:NAD-dependent epimerase/dehydratase domain-containing protein n=1 Tax=Talaromyces atroroseus TaxID=1441469 RepID=A0A1Q5Q7J5_TALAT|nr:hypothetical protein UA08_08404 [Talaromyces atroroseus]OKL56199.1 hypothetical protein UA08_08404 [Talaromyces atroroseus]